MFSLVKLNLEQRYATGVQFHVSEQKNIPHLKVLVKENTETNFTKSEVDVHGSAIADKLSLEENVFQRIALII